jgi:hypothetical protein
VRSHSCRSSRSTCHLSRVREPHSIPRSGPSPESESLSGAPPLGAPWRSPARSRSASSRPSSSSWPR